MRLPPQLVPPTALLARVRWLFLGFWLLFWGALGVHIIVSRSLWLGAPGVVGMVVLAVWWLRCCGRTRFPLWALTFEVPLLVIVGIAMPDPLELVYSVIPFRAVYSRSCREVLTTSGTVVAVTVGVSVIGPESSDFGAVAGEANSIVGTMGFACILFLATRAMAAIERSVRRERVVARAVLDFGSVRSRADLMTIVTDAAAALFVDDAPPGVRARTEPVGEPTHGDRTVATTALPLSGVADDEVRLVVEGGSPATHRENGDSLSLLAHGASLALRQLTLQQTLEAQASLDALTGLFNRRSFMGRIAEARVEAEAGTASLWLLFIDIDDFKSVNDTGGHQVGDAVLAAFADRMRASARDGDAVARLGGDEFALLLVGDPDDDGLGEVVAARLRTDLSRPVEAPGGAAVVTSASVGVVRWAPGMDSNDLLRMADAAMYRHKRGRGDDRDGLAVTRGVV